MPGEEPGGIAFDVAEPLRQRLRRWVALRLWDPLYWDGVKRSRYRQYHRDLRKVQFSAESECRDRAARALSKVLKHALTAVPYYRRVTLPVSADIDRDPFAALRAFPLLDKPTVNANQEALFVDLGLGAHSNASGGSTGTPVRLVQDRPYLDHNLAAAALFLEWTGIPPRSRVARLWGAPRDIGADGVSIRRRIGDWFANELTLNAFEMQPDDMAKHVARLNRFSPHAIVGYADALDQLARYCHSQQLQLTSPYAVVSAASSLTQEMRSRIETAFNCPVFDRYGTREVGAVAMECQQHDGLHILTDVVHVEVLDDVGREVSDGEEGELVVTALHNFTMPLIRYRIGDRAQRGSGGCACGRPYPRIRRLLGRNEACFKTARGGRVLPEFFIHLIGKEHNYGDLQRFQVVQESMERVVVRLEPISGVQPRILADQGEIAAEIERAMGSPCTVTFEVVDHIPASPTGKYLYTISRI